MTKIAYFPVVASTHELVDLLSRAAWYLTFCQLESICIPIESESLSKLEWRVASGMDDTISTNFAALRNKIFFIVVRTEGDLNTCMADADIILRWKKNLLPSFVSKEALVRWHQGKKVWQVDPVAVRMEGSFYIEVGLHLVQNKDSLIKENKKRFLQLAEKLGKFKRAYVIATGPSVWRYQLLDYGDSISIICNSVIFDEALMNHVKPKILVFADPIFHFGPSQYAAAFREKLRESVRYHNFTIIIPFKYFPLFVSTMPDLRDCTIAVPFNKDRCFNYDLNSEYEVKTTANILTLLITPLATTFADDIGFIGCDGRPLYENSYFWGHNSKTQINDKMANIRKIHPGFFSIDYNNYYLEHCNTLNAQIIGGEEQGKSFQSLGFSHIPALKQRMKLGARAGRSEKLQPIKRAILVDPDARTWAGHYMAYNEKLSSQLKMHGVSVFVTCRRDLALSIVASRPNYLPTLSAHSWEVGNRKENNTFVTSFEVEIGNVLERLFAESDEQTILYMYCGSIDHAQVLAKFVEKYPNLVVNINLFWLSFTLNQDKANEWQVFIEWLDGEIGRNRFVATLPTIELRNDLAEYTGCILPVAPHPSTGLSDRDFDEVQTRQHEGKDIDTLNVLFPSAPRPEKGYITSVECAKTLSNLAGLQPIIRHAPTFSTPKELGKPLTDVPSNVEIIEGELSDKEFLSMFGRADIVVLPYTPKAFAKRTSGLLIDALYHGIPSVVVNDTWMANLVKEYGCGVVVNDISVTSMVKGITAVAEDYEFYRSKSLAAGLAYFATNSWAAFGKYLLGSTSELSPPAISTVKKKALVLGPYPRNAFAHWDETNCIAQIFGSVLSGSTMIDIGAHHGSALIPFLNMNWEIYAFEPDEKNRTKLLERLTKHKNRKMVVIDKRCVSNTSQRGVPFYQSEQSSGISGLSVFHESHVEVQRVDTTTLTEFFQDKQLPKVDFLKVDTEGHDLFVLQGFPWVRDKPTVIECEFEDTKTVPLGYTFHDLAQFLVDKGYTVYVSEWHPIVQYGIRHDWLQLMRYPCELDNPSGWGNLLAFLNPINEADLIVAVKKVLKLGPCGTDMQIDVPSKPTFTGVSPKVDEMRGFSVKPSPFFTPIAPNQWHYTDGDAKQKLWVATISVPYPTAGRTFAGCLCVQSDCTMTVRISLGRHGKTDYEGTAQRINLVPGVSRSVKLSKHFDKEHQELKLQVEVLKLEGAGTAVVIIDDLGVLESLDSIRTHIGNDKLSLSEANRLFREGDMTTAMGMYLLLSEQRSLKMYGENAVMAARRMGMLWVKSVEELALLVG